MPGNSVSESDPSAGPYPPPAHTKLSKHVILYALCAAFNSASVGYDMGVSTNLAPLAEDYFGMTDQQLQLFVGSMHITATFAALGNQWFSDRFGRRSTFIVTSFCVMQGLFIKGMAVDYHQLIFGRMLVGIGVGVGFSIDILYVSEISPPEHRGELVSWSTIGTGVGCILGFSTGLLLESYPDHKKWRFMCFGGITFPVLMLFFAYFVMPETPRWLVLHGDCDEAERVLQAIYPPGFDVKKVVEEIKEDMEREKLANHAVGWAVFLRPTPALRRQMFLCIVALVGEFACGVEVVQYYLWEVLDAGGVTSERTVNLFLIAFAVVKVFFMCIGARLLDSKGRRFTMLLSLQGMITSLLLLLISINSTSSYRPEMTMVSLLLYVGTYGLGYSLGAWVLPVEIYSNLVRGKGVSLTTFIAIGFSTIMVSNFLSLVNAVTWTGVFSIFLGVCLFVSEVLYRYLPETNGVTLEEMTVLFAKETGDYSILEAEKRLKEAQEAKKPLSTEI